MASRRRQRRKCESKRAFDTQDAAHAAASALRHKKGHPAVAYRCRLCGRFHVGRPDARARQAIRARRDQRKGAS